MTKKKLAQVVSIFCLLESILLVSSSVLTIPARVETVKAHEISSEPMQFEGQSAVAPSYFGQNTAMPILPAHIVEQNIPTSSPTPSVERSETMLALATSVPATADLLETSSTDTLAASNTVDLGKPMVALTFDDGPSKTTVKVLDLLVEYDVKATFCVVGNRVTLYAETIRDIVDQGSEIANHTWDHVRLNTLTEREIRSQIEKTNDIIREITGAQPAFLRPCYGLVNENVKSVTKDLDMFIVTWTIDPEDWKTRDVDRIYKAIINEMEDGRIILLHDLHNYTYELLKRLIPDLLDRGYELVTVSELFDASDRNIASGKIYNRQ